MQLERVRASLAPFALLLASAAQAAPAAPSDPKAIPKGPGRIDVSWSDHSSNETGFRIERSRDGGSFSLLADVGADQTSYTDTDFTPGADDRVHYAYRVSAFDASGPSAPTAEAQAVTVFTGEPLYGWFVVTDFGAVPDDGVDDTAGIQSALDGLAGGIGAPGPHVLYFPAGTYQISAPLLLEARQAIQLVGDRNGQAVIRWQPSSPICRRETEGSFEPLALIVPQTWDDPDPAVLHIDDTLAMIHVDGSDRSTFRNLTWDANCVGTCGDLDSCRIVAFDQSYCGRIGTPEYQTGCEDIVGYSDTVMLDPAAGNADSGASHIDNVYRDAYVGLRIGHYGVQNSEITVRRSRFEGNHAGISIEDANALQISVWHSSFEQNRYGITNAYLSQDLTTSAACSQLLPVFLEGGNFHLYQSNFSQSLRTDVFIGRENNFSLFDLRSLGSFRFLSAPCKRSATSTVSVARSRVALGLPPGPAPDTEGVAIWLRNQGPLFLFDNVIDNSVWPGKPAVFADTFADAGVLSVANHFTASSPFSGPEQDLVRIAEPPPPPAPGVTLHDLPEAVDFLAGRRVYTVAQGATLRDVVHAALADPQGAAVHVPSGTFQVSETLVIPDGSDLVMLGDSEGSLLRWMGQADVPMFELDGDGLQWFALRELFLDKGSAAPLGVRVTGLDTEAQDREVVLTKLIAINTEGSDGIVIDGADRARVDIAESGAGGLSGVTPRITTGFVVRAGDEAQRSKNFWSGTGGDNLWAYQLEAGSQGLDVHMIGDRSEKVTHELLVTGGAGKVVVHSAGVGTNGTTEIDAVRVEEYAGTLSVVNVGYNDAEQDFGAVIVEADSPAAEIRSLGNSFRNGTAASALQDDHQVSSAAFDRRMVKIFCPTDALRMDACVGVEPTGSGFRTVADLGEASAESVVSGLEPIRQAEVPLFYDGAGATAQLHLDHVTLRRMSTAVRLEGAVAALLRGRFESTPLGGDPAGWLDTGPNSSLAFKDLFEVAAVDGTLALSTDSNATDIHSHFERPAGELGDWTAYEYGGRLRITRSDAGIGVTALSRFDDPSSPADAYYRLGRSSTAAFRLDVHPVAGEPLACADDSTSVVPQPHTWYRFCIQVLPGTAQTRVRAKVWAQEQNEPVGFPIDCDDTRTSRLGEGTVGVWSRSPGSKHWDDLEVRVLDPELAPPEGCLTAAP